MKLNDSWKLTGEDLLLISNGRNLSNSQIGKLMMSQASTSTGGIKRLVQMHQQSCHDDDLNKFST